MYLYAVLLTLRDRATSPWLRDDPERGDVPGWVMITVMTAGIVAALIVIAGPRLTGAFDTAISRVTG
jgi:hypothetical protein